MLTSRQLRGIFPAIPTLVDANDRIDAPAVSALFAWLKEGGIDGVLPLGGTGEYGALARAERIRMARLSVEAMAGAGPVLAGVLDTGYHDALQAVREFAAEGVDGALVLTPYYTNPTQAGIRDYFVRLADASPIPILIYEIPYRTRIAVEPRVLHELSRHPNIVGMKACNLDMYHFLQVVAGVSEDFTVLSGEDSLFPLHVAAGAKGGILVTASLLPRAWRGVFDAAAGGRTAEALALHRELMPMMNLAFAETNPGPMKSIIDLIGVSAPRMLAPLVDAAPGLSNAFRAEVSQLLARTEAPR